jgi:hypothetical protein
MRWLGSQFEGAEARKCLKSSIEPVIVVDMFEKRYETLALKNKMARGVGGEEALGLCQFPSH